MDIRPKCINCGINLAEKRTVNGKTYYRKECSKCSRMRRGKPLYYGFSCAKRKRAALQMGINTYRCKRCGWEGYCHVHHKDGNWKNNARENLIILCPNCHMDEHHGKPS